jgi:hypothetical protein
MKKTKWIEQHKEDLKRYDKSILSRDDDEHDSMKDYEFSIMHHDDDSQYGGDDWYEPMRHFSD